jgi:hypothetical protein
MLDNGLVLAEGQAVTAEGDTGSTSTYDAGSAALGSAGLTGENLWVQAFCSTTVTSAGSATVQAVLQDSSDNATWVDVVAGPAIAKASLLAGTPMLQVQPPVSMLRYWRIAWRVGTAVLTAGKFDAFISNTLQNNVAQPSGFSVS